jgi:hypothetical protein
MLGEGSLSSGCSSGHWPLGLGCCSQAAAHIHEEYVCPCRRRDGSSPRFTCRVACGVECLQQTHGLLCIQAFAHWIAGCQLPLLTAICTARLTRSRLPRAVPCTLLPTMCCCLLMPRSRGSLAAGTDRQQGPAAAGMQQGRGVQLGFMRTCHPSWCTLRMEPQPPKRSFPHPNTT